MVTITVLSVTPTRAGKLLALASVELVIDDVPLTIHGIQALRVEPIGTTIELPKFRAATGEWQTAISLPDDLHGPIGDIVREALVEHGLAPGQTASNAAAA
jgi:stage V sporulation protein G